MYRTITFFKDCTRQRDWSALLLGFVILVAFVATISILFSQQMRIASLKRFHLASDNFPAWAAHQFVPSMYNFENKIWFSNLATDLNNVDENDATLIKDTLNHFPARHITYGHFRQKHFGDHDQAVFKMVSTYRGQRLVSTWKINKRDDTLWVTRIDEQLQTAASDENE